MENINLVEVILVILVVNMVFQIIWMYWLYERIIKMKDKHYKELLNIQSKYSWTKWYSYSSKEAIDKAVKEIWKEDNRIKF